MTTSLHPIRARSGRRTAAVPGSFAPALFVLTAALLSAVGRDHPRGDGSRSTITAFLAEQPRLCSRADGCRPWRSCRRGPR